MAPGHFFFAEKKCIILFSREPDRLLKKTAGKKMKKKLPLILGLVVIILVTAALLFLPFGKSDAPEKSGEPGVDTEVATEQPVTESTKVTEIPTESQVSTETDPRVITEQPTQAVTTEETTEALVPAEGPQVGKLGSSFTIPAGFYDFSPREHEDGYFHIYRNPELDMQLQVAEFHLEDRRVGFDGEYTVFHNMYKNDTGTEVTYDTKEDDHYVISGYTQNGARAFYIEAYKYVDRNEIQITADYPCDGNEDTCREMLDVLLESYRYDYIPNPDQKQTEADPFADPLADPYAETPADPFAGP